MQHHLGPEGGGGGLLAVPPAALANLCVCYVITSQNDVAEDLLRRMEEETTAAQVGSWRAQACRQAVQAWCRRRCTAGGRRQAGGEGVGLQMHGPGVGMGSKAGRLGGQQATRSRARWGDLLLPLSIGTGVFTRTAPSLALQAAGQPLHQHLSLANLAIGTLYCSKGGLLRVPVQMWPGGRCACAPHHTCGRRRR